jgi:hypothetical protein
MRAYALAAIRIAGEMTLDELRASSAERGAPQSSGVGGGVGRSVGPERRNSGRRLNLPISFGER